MSVVPPRGNIKKIPGDAEMDELNWSMDCNNFCHNVLFVFLQCTRVNLTYFTEAVNYVCPASSKGDLIAVNP